MVLFPGFSASSIHLSISHREASSIVIPSVILGKKYRQPILKPLLQEQIAFFGDGLETSFCWHAFAYQPLYQKVSDFPIDYEPRTASLRILLILVWYPFPSDFSASSTSYLLFQRHCPIPFRMGFMRKASPCGLFLCYLGWILIRRWYDSLNLL